MSSDLLGRQTFSRKVDFLPVRPSTIEGKISYSEKDKIDLESKTKWRELSHCFLFTFSIGYKLFLELLGGACVMSLNRRH